MFILFVKSENGSFFNVNFCIMSFIFYNIMVRFIETTLCNNLLTIFFRVLPKIISWHFEKKYKISLKIGRIGLPYFKLCDLMVSKNGFDVVSNSVHTFWH